MGKSKHWSVTIVLRLCGLFCICACIRAAGAADLVAKTEARSPEEQRALFRLPPGFEIQLVASEPDIHKPMNIAFDAKGRLWVTDTIEYPYPAKDPEKTRDAVKILADIGPDGRARTITTFADNLNIPIGLLPIENGVLVHSIPSIHRMLDTDGDGKADQRDVLLTGYGSRDTHGMTNHFTVGFDGWIYANHGFSNTSTVKASDGSEITMESGNTYRFKQDGSHIEHFAHGQVNPFGLTFDLHGNLFSADCHTRPQMMLLRGGYYQSFGKPDDGLGFAPEMCFHDHGSTGIAGTLVYLADQFPAEYRGTIFNGNPVTAIVNRDVLEAHGSTRIAKEQRDFLTCVDPWFRPVDLKLGPDGAIYIADFYNRIIGHYEVPLTHPGRDKDKGRIWRIVYRGPDGQGAVQPLRDLSSADAKALIAALSDGNQAIRMMAANQLVDRVGAAAADAVRSALAGAENSHLKVHGLWVLFRFGAASDEMIAKATLDADPVVRTHAMRVISETPKLSPRLAELAIAGLADADADVRRAAADALGQHPSKQNVGPLLQLRRDGVPADDSQLLHVVRMSLRNQFQADGMLAALASDQLAPQDEAALADVALGATGPEVAGFLVRHLNGHSADGARTTRYLLHAARWSKQQDVDSLADLALKLVPDNLDVQRQLYTSLLQGIAQRGAAPGDKTRTWGATLSKRLLETHRPSASPGRWTAAPLPGRDEAKPWLPEARPFNSDAARSLWSTFPLGETATGTWRSSDFDLPKTLSLSIAGQDGLPGVKDPQRNVVHLRLADNGEIAFVAPVPRNDAPQRLTWDLSKFAGRRGYLEAVDANDRQSYAWIAIGEIDPPVAPNPPAVGAAGKEQLIAAAMIARELKLVDRKADLRDVASDPVADREARVMAVRALGVLSDDADTVALLVTLASDSLLDLPLREAAAQSLGEVSGDAARTALFAALAVAPQQTQRSLAMTLASRAETAEALLGAVEGGKASPRLLQDEAIKERLAAAGVANLDDRLGMLTKGLVPISGEAQKLIDDRVAVFRRSGGVADRGAKVFTTNCAACHRVGEEGALIGPQLTGVGKRGVERIVEDVLDPSRNIDAAFRVTLMQTADGDTVAGLFRREEGELLVLADSTGKEISVSKANVQRKVISGLSLMPGNFGEIITAEDFADLVAFLAVR